MPELDRRITVRVATETTNDFGESESVTTDHRVWGALIQDSVARSIDAGGTYGLAARSWRVRFNQAFLTAHEAGATITVVYGDEDADVVTGIGEPEVRRGENRRRRFLDLLT